MEKMSNCAYKITHLENSFFPSPPHSRRKSERAGMREIFHMYSDCYIIIPHSRTPAHRLQHIICYVFPICFSLLRFSGRASVLVRRRWNGWLAMARGENEHRLRQHKINCYIFPFSISTKRYTQTDSEELSNAMEY